MPKRWWTLVAVGLATFMTYLDNNVTNVALPTIQRSLHLSVAGLEWVVSSYILVFASLLLAGGRLADVYGRRLLFMAGLAVFTLSSLAAGLAGSGAMLVSFRVLQGLGAAMLVPTTLAIIAATFTNPRERTAAVGAWTAIGALALAFGPLIGGYISQHLHWGWIFLINVPVGIVTAALAAWSMTESKDTTSSGRLDIPGLITSSAALSGLTYALIEGHDLGWTSPAIAAAFGLFAAAGSAFLIFEARSSHPMVTLSLFRSRIFSGGIAATMLWAFGIFGIYFFTSLYLQNVLGFSPTKAGLAFVPMAVTMAVFAGIGGPLAARVGAWRTVSLGLALVAAGVWLVSLLGQSASFASLMPGFLLVGIGSGLNVPLTDEILKTMPPDRSGIASAVLNAAREVSGLLGITVIGAVLRTGQASALGTGARPAAAFLHGYQQGLLVTVALVAGGAVVAFAALRRPGRPASVPVAAGPVPAGRPGAVTVAQPGGAQATGAAGERAGLSRETGRGDGLAEPAAAGTGPVTG